MTDMRNHDITQNIGDNTILPVVNRWPKLMINKNCKNIEDAVLVLFNQDGSGTLLKHPEGFCGEHHRAWDIGHFIEYAGVLHIRNNWMDEV